MNVAPYTLPFRAPIRTAAGVFRARRGWILTLRDGDRIGRGDAAPWPGFGDGRSSGDALAALSTHPERLRGLRAADVPSLGLPPEAAHAVQQALMELRGESAGPLMTRSVGVHALVSSPVELAGRRALKIKVGGDLDEDDARVAAIRAAAPHARLRLDANGAWSPEMALRAAARLSRHGLEWIEQPTRSLAGLAAVRALGVTVAADESVGSLADLEAVIAHGAADVIVVKPMFAGGPMEARAIAVRALGAGLRVIVTCALESAIGRLGALRLAATLPGDEDHGLEAPLAEDLAPFPPTVDGRLAVPPEGPC